MKTVALDQNKWVEVAIAWTRQEVNPSERDKLFNLVNLANSGAVRFPLAFTNIYETMKISDASRRSQIAYVQAALSKGAVFVGRKQQRQKEVKDLLRRYFKMPRVEEEQDWYVSYRFWEAAVPTDDLDLGVNMSVELSTLVNTKPAEALYSYLTDTDNATRARSVREYSAGVGEVLARIEKRQKLCRQYNPSMRRRVLSVHMFMENQDHFWKAADDLGLPVEKFRDGEDSMKRDLIRSVPCLFIERELALKIEAEDTKITENDVRDILFMSTTLPYADVVVAEKPFTQRARQAGLHKKYSTAITSELSDLTSLCRA